MYITHIDIYIYNVTFIIINIVLISIISIIINIIIIIIIIAIAIAPPPPPPPPPRFIVSLKWRGCHVDCLMSLKFLKAVKWATFTHFIDKHVINIVTYTCQCLYIKHKWKIYSQHWNGNVILKKFSSPAALKVVNLITFSSLATLQVVKMTTFGIASD